MRLIDADVLFQPDENSNTVFVIGGQGCGGKTVALAMELLKRKVAEAPTIETAPQWIPASEPPAEYRNAYGELIPFLVCVDGTDYPFRAMYDGKKWGDGLSIIAVKWWMPLPKPPGTDLP